MLLISCWPWAKLSECGSLSLPICNRGLASALLVWQGYQETAERGRELKDFKVWCQFRAREVRMTKKKFNTSMTQIRKFVWIQV